jgi:outer membrane protein OmpA-like peptidoglycan-associated protein/tetratricopeptide (TPR) repeat protein
MQSQSLRLKKANKYFHEFSYDKAIKAYKKIDDKTPVIYRNMAKSYLVLGNSVQAEDSYGNLMNTGKYKPQDVYDYARVLLMNKRYNDAAGWMQKYYKLNPKDSRAVKFMEDPDYYKELLKVDSGVVLSNLDINTEYEDFSPIYYKDDKIIFASSRKNSFLVDRKWNGNRQPFLDLYKTTLSENNTLTDVQDFDTNVNKKYHDAPATFNKSGDYMIVTRNIYTDDKLKENKLWLYESDLENEQYWSIPNPLHFNSKEYNCGQASMSPDGQMMYFTSDMPGGKGGTDIYKVEKKSDGTWGTPINLGDRINTEGNEMFPFYDAENGYLFFSSEGLPGLGGLDIFVTKIQRDGSFTPPKNLGSPINSNADDFSLIYKEDGSGFLSSNRVGGKGDDDIYSFINLMKFKEEVKACYLAGTITDKVTQAPLELAEIVLYSKEGKKLKSFETKQDGTYMFPIDCGEAYKLIVVRDGYEKATAEIDSKNFDTSEIIKDFALVKIIDKNEEPDNMCDLHIKPLYYDLDKFFIRYNDQIQLNEIIGFMNKYSDMILEISSHTDSRATHSYNVELSHNRTNSIVEYLTAHGIKKDRLVSKWFGEVRLTNKCSDGVKCTEAEHQLNRRTEFRILNCNK